MHVVLCCCEFAAVRPPAEGHFLQEQAEAIKVVSEYVSQLRRVGKGLGVFEFDRYLSEELEKAA
jgi:ferritin heavy chain